MKKAALRITLLALGGLMHQAYASVIGLHDWCVNLNGDINTACNGAGSGGTSPGGGSIDLTNYDRTLDTTGPNNLGTITVTLASGLHQYVNFYADYDVDYTTFLLPDDIGSTSGVRPPGVTFELDDPNTSNIFSDFANNTLTNTNNVGAPAPSNCCDVSFSIGLGDLNVLPGGSGTVTFTLSRTAPSGYYLKQANRDTLDSIYLQGTASILNPIPGVPEPSTFALVSGLAGAGFLWRLLRLLRNQQKITGKFRHCRDAV